MPVENFRQVEVSRNAVLDLNKGLIAHLMPVDYEPNKTDIIYNLCISALAIKIAEVYQEIADFYTTGLPQFLTANLEKWHYGDETAQNEAKEALLSLVQTP